MDDANPEAGGVEKRLNENSLESLEQEIQRADSVVNEEMDKDKQDFVDLNPPGSTNVLRSDAEVSLIDKKGPLGNLVSGFSNWLLIPFIEL